MKKIILIPDSFKGSLSSLQAARIMERVIRRRYPECAIFSMPISDGGEGFLTCLLETLPGRKITTEVTGPSGVPIHSAYGMLSDRTAVIELAKASGLGLTQPGSDPGLTTTAGVGELIRHAVANGARTIWIGLGGSATNDGGCGLAEAMGILFYTSDGTKFRPTGATLSMIDRIDLSRVPKDMIDVQFRLFTDVLNPLCGPEGASVVFAPQKGADPAKVMILETNMAAFAALLRRRYNFNTNYPGAGAAGGAGVLLKCFFDVTLHQGIDTMLDLVGFDRKAIDADLVITGEGRLDRQTLQGKAIHGIAKRCQALAVPLVAFVGSSELTPDTYPAGLNRVVEITPKSMPIHQALSHAKKLLEGSVDLFLSQKIT